ncbi:glycosyltransferase [Gangjinia marincola]|uniref:Glycosyltransferase n=1 Tax=Gangjinia marincola TaxID=578463 RepID=A0ABN1MEV2_9FLAO
MTKPVYSFIIPVYNRPQEIRELLGSMLELDGEFNYEVVIVEDGSQETSKGIVEEFRGKIDINYHPKENTGPGHSRNVGMSIAQADYFIILDSDVLLPPNYLNVVDEFLSQHDVDCYGGPDAAHESFSPTQKAIDYVMTSWLTTGGIRGKKGTLSYEPRSFNMGLSKKAFEATGGFGSIHPGEDPDLSIRLKKQGFTIGLITSAFVFHKRRISWDKFFIQVSKFGRVRPILNSWHPKHTKLTFWFPTFFCIGFIISLVTLAWGNYLLVLCYASYVLAIFIDATRRYQSGKIGLMAVKAMCYQFFGYGKAFLESTIRIGWLKLDPKKEYPELFFDR